jgi:2-alkyl-3-oxoalkanoate reductase
MMKRGISMDSIDSRGVSPPKPMVLITGAGGFLGAEIAKQALGRGMRVKGIARGRYPHMEELGVEMTRGDITNPTALEEAIEGCEAVFHVAAKAGAWGSYTSYYQSNVQGTQRVIDACRSAGVGKLIFTSSPSVVHSGGDIEGGDESLPYSEHFLASYPKTKAASERLALEANDTTLAVTALRPHLIWGPGDRHLIPRLLDRADRGKLRHLTPHKLVDSIYIEDAGRAHLNAYDALEVGAECAGRAYFISQGEPWPIEALINGILEAHHRAPVHRRLNPKLAYYIGALLESLYRIFRIQREPMMTRFIADQLSTAHWFDITAAQRDLSYKPQRSINEALEALRHAYEREQALKE